MVRLGLIILLLLCVTITGVYATWTYAGTDDIADAYAESKITIADTELTGANGIYKIESNLVLTIDQANDNHEAELVFSSNDGKSIYLKVTFTPANNAPQAIKDNAVPSELYFTTTTTMEYKMDADGNYSASGTAVPILKFTNPSDGVFSPNVSWTKQADGTFTYELNEDQLKAQISLAQTFVLDIKSEHDAFREALSGNIVARITDGTVN
jgi:hypothetical protein